jgi:hypothetical protein
MRKHYAKKIIMGTIALTLIGGSGGLISQNAFAATSTVPSTSVAPQKDNQDTWKALSDQFLIFLNGLISQTTFAVTSPAPVDTPSPSASTVPSATYADPAATPVPSASTVPSDSTVPSATYADPIATPVPATSVTPQKDNQDNHSWKGLRGVSDQLLTFLKLDKTTFKTKSATETLAQIATDQGISRDALKAELTTEKNAQLDKEKADFAANIDKTIDSTNGDFGGRPGRSNGRHGGAQHNAKVNNNSSTTPDTKVNKDSDDSATTTPAS